MKTLYSLEKKENTTEIDQTQIHEVDPELSFKIANVTKGMRVPPHTTTSNNTEEETILEAENPIEKDLSENSVEVAVEVAAEAEVERTMMIG